MSLLDAIASLRIVQDFVGGTDWERGAWLWATYGTFTFAAFALADHAVPRILRRAWGGGFLPAAQLWLAFGGVTLAGLALMGGGMAEGSLRAQGTAPDAAMRRCSIYHAIAFAGIRDGRPGRPGIADEPVPDVRQRRAGRVHRAGRQLPRQLGTEPR